MTSHQFYLLNGGITQNVSPLRLKGLGCVREGYKNLRYIGNADVQRSEALLTTFLADIC